MTLEEFANQKIQECRKMYDCLEKDYKSGYITDEEKEKTRMWHAGQAWHEIENFCAGDKIVLGDKGDSIYRELFNAVGITIRKVPVRYYPRMESFGSFVFLCFKNAESFFYDDNPVGKTFKFKQCVKFGEEKVFVDYLFKPRYEDYNLEKEGQWSGWKCFEGLGKLEGYNWADASVNVREYEGEIQAVSCQKTYPRGSDPIRKRRSATPVEGRWWVSSNYCFSLYDENPDKIVIPEGGFYYDETTAPPKGRHYKVQGILAYDDTEEITILGIRDQDAEVVEIPSEINGKPVTVIDEGCFENCYRTLKKVILPNTIKVIGDAAFRNCEKLEKPEIPASVKKIGKDLFQKTYVDSFFD